MAVRPLNTTEYTRIPSSSPASRLVHSDSATWLCLVVLTRVCGMGEGYPTLNLPGLSDVGPQPTNVLGFLTAGAGVFGRPDFRWFSSGGKTGRPPRSASHDFTHGGCGVMRDKWGPDSQVLVFDAGNFGSGHQTDTPVAVSISPRKFSVLLCNTASGSYSRGPQTGSSRPSQTDQARTSRSESESRCRPARSE